MKKLIPVLLLSLAFLGCGKSDDKKENTPQEIVKDVKLQNLEPQSIIHTKTYNGDLKPLNEISVITPTGGYVKDSYFKNGDNITTGSIVLKLTDANTEATYAESEGNLLKAKSNYNTSKVTYTKYETLFKKALISEELYLDSKNKMDQNLGELKIAEASYIRAKDNFDRLSPKSNINGILTDFNLKKDEKVTANSILFTIVENKNMEVTIAVNGEDIKNITVGKEAKVYIPSLNETILGKVDNINLSANNDTKKYEIKIVIPNENSNLLKGMYSKIDLNLETVNGLFVPKEAVMIKDLYSYVAIVRDDKVLIYKVDRGMSQDNLQEIIFNEYKDGDKIVVQGQYLLNNNDKVREI